MESRLDIIIFGASGFTGKRTIPQLTKIIKSEKLSLTWGVAGRTPTKVKDALIEMAKLTGENYSNIPIICADVNDIQSIENMTAQAKIVINTVGPYRFLGETVVEACIKSGTHHVDVSAEVQFIETIKLKYHKIALEKGVYLVSACGLESIPADLGSIFLKKNFEGTLNSIESYAYRSEEGGCRPGAVGHYTTFESGVYVLTHYNELQTIQSKLYPERLPQLKPKLNKGLVFKSKLLNRWTTILPMAHRSVMEDTQRFMYKTHKQRPIQIQTYFCYDSFLHMVAIIFMFCLMTIMCKLDFTRKILLKYPRFFTYGEFSHEGPSEEKQENTYFHNILVGQGWNEKLAEPTDEFTIAPNKTLIAKVTCKSPGYGCTCIAVALSAIMVLTEADKIPNNGGCYSSGAAFANTSLIEKLKKYGMKFELNPEL